MDAIDKSPRASNEARLLRSTLSQKEEKKKERPETPAAKRGKLSPALWTRTTYKKWDHFLVSDGEESQKSNQRGG